MTESQSTPYYAPCEGGAGSESNYTFVVLALSSETLNVDETQTQVELMQQIATDSTLIASQILSVKRVFWNSESLSENLHVPETTPSTCAEKEAHFNSYASVHVEIDCDENTNLMRVTSHIASGLKTSLSDQQHLVGIETWIGKVVLPQQSGFAFPVVPDFYDQAHDNFSCDGATVYGYSVDGQVILPWHQSQGLEGEQCGPFDGRDYAQKDILVRGGVDQCYGHGPALDGYHLHGIPVCLMDVHDPSTPIAYMADCIPLYLGTGGGTVNESEHAQTAKIVTDVNYGAGLYEHLNYLPADVKDGSNPLNECNAYDINGDGAESGYIYHTTQEPPYTIGCFMGTVPEDRGGATVDKIGYTDQRMGWPGQNENADNVLIVSNEYGEFNGKTYNITEMLVRETTSYFEEGDFAQVLWRILDASDDNYDETLTCFEFRYRANKENTDSDLIEYKCYRGKLPDETLNFTPYGGN